MSAETKLLPVVAIGPQLDAASKLVNYNIPIETLSELWHVMQAAVPEVDDPSATKLLPFVPGTLATRWRLDIPPTGDLTPKMLPSYIGTYYLVKEADKRVMELLAAAPDTTELAKLERELANRHAHMEFFNLCPGYDSRNRSVRLSSLRRGRLRVELAARYLELRGLLQRDPSDPDLVTVLDPEGVKS